MKLIASNMTRFALAVLYCALGCGAAAAGEFTVNPIRLELAAAVRSGVITVRNEGKEKLGFQLQAVEWTQDAQGKDQYAPTQDLVFFPKLMTVEPEQEGLVRVGAKNAVVSSEKTYRLFIEELPGPAKGPEGAGAQLNVLIRFGAPIFVTPVKSEDGLAIEQLSLAKGVLSLSARNTGNRHQLVQGIQLKGADAKGNEVYGLQLADRYLLAGTVKSYTASIEAAQCARLAELVAEVKTDKLTARRKLDVTRAMCP